ncbi:unnamed protein product [Fusarium graminearum]|uniref:Uncharacterized protein n=1 Tax=Gibberella zeae TaxID=5518 RepID=A0A4E9EE06_GIBZA|nr:unnamed protein product [Fusarium graminearum]CAF3619597.1 unnamed protein product [Fusarium graminearum]CAG1963222.1 unnamed protein product [Fusarium graminearum]CAG1992308.1 unnamed protein product [Fusarium graminearum]
MYKAGAALDNYVFYLRLSAVDVPKIVLRSQCSLSTFDRYVCRNHLTPTGPAPRPARHFEDEAPQAATSIFQSRQSTRLRDGIRSRAKRQFAAQRPSKGVLGIHAKIADPIDSGTRHDVVHLSSVVISRSREAGSTSTHDRGTL